MLREYPAAVVRMENRSLHVLCTGWASVAGGDLEYGTEKNAVNTLEMRPDQIAATPFGTL